MNEKYLLELWEKSKHPHPKYGGQDMIWPAEFAELIIQECIEICDKVQIKYGQYTFTARICKEDIKTHFGVE